MADWTASAGHTYEFWFVDPATWRDTRQLSLVESCTITRDDSEIRGSADLEVGESVEGECYVREYLVVEQPPGSGNRERFCLGTHLVQTPTFSYTGKRITRSLTAYSPLQELADSKPPIGYTVAAGSGIAAHAAQICRIHGRAPVVAGEFAGTLVEPMVAADDDTWLTFLAALLAKADLEYTLDAYGRVGFAPVRNPGALLPTWTYTDDTSSILMPEVEESYDWYGIPNVYEAVLSSSDSSITARVVNDSPGSPLSTVVRGREVLERDTSPEVLENATVQDLENYALMKLRELSCVERSLEYTHGYNEVRVGDGVALNYERHDLRARAKVVKQEITCDTSCLVKETASYTESLWR